MNIYNKEMNSVLAILGTIFTWLFGAWDLSLMILVTVMALDYVTGVTRGYVNKQLSSEYGFRGECENSCKYLRGLNSLP